MVCSPCVFSFCIPLRDVLWAQEHTLQKGTAQGTVPFLKLLVLPGITLKFTMFPPLLLLHLVASRSSPVQQMLSTSGINYYPTLSAKSLL